MQDLLRRRQGDEYIDWVRWRTQVDEQLGRILLDQKNERETYSKMNIEFNQKFNALFSRLNKQDRLLYMILGGIVVANTAIIIFFELLKTH